MNQIYNGRGLPELYFRYFGDYLIMHIFIILFLANFLNNVTSMIMWDVEMLESVSWAKCILRGPKGNLQGWKIKLARMGLLVVTTIISDLFDDLALIYSLNGIFLSSFISLVVPGILGLIRKDYFRLSDSAFTVVKDWVCAITGIAIMVHFILESIFT